MSLTAAQRDLARRFVPWARGIAVTRAVLYRRFNDVDEIVASALERLSRAAAGFEASDPACEEEEFKAYAHKWVAGGAINVIDGENRHLGRPRRAMLQAATDAIGGGSGAHETADEAIDELDRIAADAMEGWRLGCAAEERHHGHATELLHPNERLDLDAALAELDPDDRRLVDLRYYDGLSWEEVSDALDVPEGTLKARDARIRKALRKKLR
jgi:RNA polymerase sigma factor (sigma-70 family)